MKLTEKLWNLLNSPLAVVMIGLSVWPLLTAFTAQHALSKITTDTIASISQAFESFDDGKSQKASAFIAIKEKVTFSNVNDAFTSWPNKEKIVATITNGSDAPITSIMLNVSFYDAGNRLIDVLDNQWLSNISVLQPGESMNFSLTRAMGGGNEPPEALAERKSARVDIALASAKKL